MRMKINNEMLLLWYECSYDNDYNDDDDADDDYDDKKNDNDNKLGFGLE